MAQVDAVSSSPVAKALFLASSDHTPGNFTPTAPDGLNHHGEERDALGGALGAGILMAALQVLVPAGNSVSESGVSVQPQAKATGDGKVPSGGRAQPPPRNIHVSRAPRSRSGVLLAAGSQATGFASGAVGFRNPGLLTTQSVTYSCT